MLRNICLHGFLAQQFPAVLRMDVDSAAEAVRALSCQLKGFSQALRGGEYRLLRDKEPMDETELLFSLGNADLHIVPVPAGSKDNGVFKIILGGALLGIGFAIQGPLVVAGVKTGFMVGFAKALITGGAGMALQGVGMMLSPTPQVDSNESADKKQSYLFSGPVNVTEEGNCIPVAYGAPWCGSLVLSAGMDVDQVL